MNLMMEPFAFFIFSISLFCSIFATFSNDFVRIQTSLFTQKFGIFESCFLTDGGTGLLQVLPLESSWIYHQSRNKSSSAVVGKSVKRSQLSYCQDFPGKCKIQLPDNGKSFELTFCQAWLLARYIQVVAVAFGVAAWITWILSSYINLMKQCALLLITLYSVTQVINMQLFQHIRENDIFLIGGLYGYSFSALNASWGLGVIVAVTLIVSIIMNRQQQQVAFLYVAIP